MIHITTISLIVLSILFFIAIFILGGYLEKKHGPGAGVPLVILLILSIPLVVISCIDQECIITGLCRIWGWIRFILYILLLIILTINIYIQV